MTGVGLFLLGVWMIVTVWFLVELVTERIRQAQQQPPEPCPHHLETVTETAMRAMLTEALNMRMGLQRRDS